MKISGKGSYLNFLEIDRGGDSPVQRVVLAVLWGHAVHAPPLLQVRLQPQHLRRYF